MCPVEMRVQGITQEVTLLPVKRVVLYTRVSSSD